MFAACVSSAFGVPTRPYPTHGELVAALLNRDGDVIRTNLVVPGLDLLSMQAALSETDPDTVIWFEETFLDPYGGAEGKLEYDRILLLASRKESVPFSFLDWLSSERNADSNRVTPASENLATMLIIKVPISRMQWAYNNGKATFIPNQGDGYLSRAVMYDHDSAIEIVEWLCSLGATPGRTTISHIILYGRHPVELIEHMVQKGATITPDDLVATAGRLYQSRCSAEECISLTEWMSTTFSLPITSEYSSALLDWCYMEESLKVMAWVIDKGHPLPHDADEWIQKTNAKKHYAQELYDGMVQLLVNARKP